MTDFFKSFVKQTYDANPALVADYRAGSVQRRAQDAALKAQSALNQLAAAATAIHSDDSLSSKGRADRLAAKAAEPLKALRRSVWEVQHARAAAEKVSASFRPAFDRADLASVLNRQEIRSFLRGLNDAPKAMALAAADPAIAEAAVEASPVLSGLPKDFHTQLSRDLVVSRHGDVYGEAEKADELITLAGSIVEMAQREAADLMGDDDAGKATVAAAFGSVDREAAEQADGTHDGLIEAARMAQLRGGVLKLEDIATVAKTLSADDIGQLRDVLFEAQMKKISAA